MAINNVKYSRKLLSAVLAAVLLISSLPFTGALSNAEAATEITASGKISMNGIILRKHASTSSKALATLKSGQKLTIHREVFTDKRSSDASSRWYYVSAGNTSGYVKTIRVSDITWSNTTAVTTDSLNYRTGPSTSFKRLGTIKAGGQITLLLPAKLSGSDSMWYKAKIGDKTAFVSATYVKPGTSLFIQMDQSKLSSKPAAARALLTNPTKGGKMRVVYTFSQDNCQKLFPIQGTGIATVPQGFTYTGSNFYILYGMEAGQAVVTYSSDGKRLGESPFAFCIGHPNGITWDPVTKMCYIFKGNQKTIYTWNPATNKYGKSKTPYSSSGVGYDNSTGLIYATSHTGIRAYSADGKFKHNKLFSRCTPGFFHYIQDCGAGEGFIFHGISGSKKKEVNYLDVYRSADNAYLGSIKVTMGELESSVVGPDGWLYLLINQDGRTDYIWKTPLRVKDLN